MDTSALEVKTEPRSLSLGDGDVDLQPLELPPLARAHQSLHWLVVYRTCNSIDDDRDRVVTGALPIRRFRQSSHEIH